METIRSLTGEVDRFCNCLLFVSMNFNQDINFLSSAVLVNLDMCTALLRNESHKSFLDDAHERGLRVVPGMSDFPYTQMVPGRCIENDYDCFNQSRDSYTLNLQTGFLTDFQDWVGTEGWNDLNGWSFILRVKWSCCLKTAEVHTYTQVRNCTVLYITRTYM